jgi:hypothetical protein
VPGSRDLANIEENGMTALPNRDRARLTGFCVVLVLQFAATTAPARAQSPSFYDIVRVTEVYNLQYKNSVEKDRDGVLKKRKAGLNDIIIIHVHGLQALLKRAKCQPPYEQQPCREQEIALYLDGRVIRGLKPESGAPTLEDSSAARTRSGTPDTLPRPEKVLNGTLRYHLQRNVTSSTAPEDNEEQWADLLGLGSDIGGWHLKRQVDVSVGLADEYPVRTDVKSGATGDTPFYLVRMRPFWLLFWIGFTALCVLVIYQLATKSDMLRDRAPVLWGQRKPYSLSAFQAAWWFVLILISFAFIWVVTGQYDLSATALVLLGIGFGTGLGATIIDSNKKGGSSDAQIRPDELNSLLSDKEKLETELSRLVGTAEFGSKKADYDAKIDVIKRKFPNAIGSAHERWSLDILSDASGVSFHRFQMFAWTLVLGVVFIYSVLSRLAMPRFSETLLALMGISAGTYLAFKIPERNEVATQETTPPKP